MKYKWLVLTNTTVATLMASIDTNIVLISLPTIGRELAQTTGTILLWILLGYSLFTAVILLNFGRLSDLYGRVRLYVLGFAIFTGGSLICGFSQTGLELVGFRMIQAVGAAFLFSNSAAIITDAFPAHERGRALGINQVSIVGGALVGLVLGGYITSTLGWRWIFFVNVPIGVVAVIRAHYDLQELSPPAVKPQIDWMGNLVFAGGLSLLLLGITLGALGDVSDLQGIVIAVLGLALLLGFPFIERLAQSPMLDLTLLRNRIFAGAVLATFLNALARGAFTFVLVFYLQGPPRFLTPFQAGLYLIPVSASMVALGPLSGYFSDKYGARGFLVAGLVCSASGFLLLTTIPAVTSILQLTPPLILIGAGMGLFAAPNRAAMMTAVPAQRRGVASGMGITFVNTGATVSLGITLVIMRTVMPQNAIAGILLGTATSGAVASGFLSSIHLIFLISALFCLGAIVPSVLRGPESDE